MKKIPFKNGQGPYLSDTTLKELQDNIEEEIDKQIEEDFIDKVTFNEAAIQSHCQFIKKGNMVFIVYQGEVKTHNEGTKLCTIPVRL